MKKFYYIMILGFSWLYFINNTALADSYSDGLAALKQNRPGDALKCFSASLQENKNNPYAMYYMGVTLQKLGEPERAARAFETASKLNPPADLLRQLKAQSASGATGKVSINAPMQSNIRKMPAGSNVPNYLSQVTPGGKVCRWDLKKMPLKVHVANGYNVKGFKPEYNNMIIKAIQDWQSAMQGKISFKFIPNAKDADIKIAWIEGLEGDRIGENPFVSLQNVILRSDVNMTPFMPNGRVKTPAEMYSIMLHELGHVLGFQGHSPNKSDVMYFSLNQENYNSKLTARDIATMKILYNLQADVSNKLPLDMAKTKEFYKHQLTAEKFIVKNDYKNALNSYLAAQKLYDGDYNVHFNIGICYMHLNSLQSAIKALEKAKSLKPDDTLIRFNLAMSQIHCVSSLKPEEASKAIEYYKQAEANLEAIQNKNDKPPITDSILSNLKTALAPY